MHMRDMDVCNVPEWLSRFEDRRFGRFEHSYTTAFRGLVQIVRQYVSNNGQYQTSIAPYHGYKGLSSMPNLAGNRQTILDTKQSYIYKHHIAKHYMFDMRICGYKGLI